MQVIPVDITEDEEYYVYHRIELEVQEEAQRIWDWGESFTRFMKVRRRAGARRAVPCCAPCCVMLCHVLWHSSFSLRGAGRACAAYA